jgi:hypothetical protein
MSFSYGRILLAGVLAFAAIYYYDAAQTEREKQAYYHQLDLQDQANQARRDAEERAEERRLKLKEEAEAGEERKYERLVCSSALHPQHAEYRKLGLC